MLLSRWVLSSALCVMALAAGAAETSLYDRVKAGMSCEDSQEHGRYCEYKVAGSIDIGIKDVGGEHTVIGFRHSDVDAELYGVFYGGCVAVVPGKGNASPKHRDYGVFISPRNGEVYRTSVECEHSLQ